MYFPIVNCCEKKKNSSRVKIETHVLYGTRAKSFISTPPSLQGTYLALLPYSLLGDIKLNSNNMRISRLQNRKNNNFCS